MWFLNTFAVANWFNGKLWFQHNSSSLWRRREGLMGRRAVMRAFGAWCFCLSDNPACVSLWFSLLIRAVLYGDWEKEWQWPVGSYWCGCGWVFEPERIVSSASNTTEERKLWRILNEFIHWLCNLLFSHLGTNYHCLRQTPVNADQLLKNNKRQGLSVICKLQGHHVTPMSVNNRAKLTLS